MIGPPLSNEIQSNEDFTRFIFTQKYYSAGNKRVKPQAMLTMLNKTTNRWETSTYRIHGLTATEMWKIGYDHAEDAANNRVIKARGQGTFACTRSAGLSLDVNGPPHPRHVDVIGWSSTDKDVRLMKATEITDKMFLEVDPRH
jgi:hypothetical protein